MNTEQKASYQASESTYKAIRDWREEERPREKLAMYGPGTLTDSELLAIMIGSGTKAFSALDIARQLLDIHGSLSRLSSCDASEFRKVQGLGFARSVTLAAAFELSRRVQSEPFDNRSIIRSPEELARYYIPRLRDSRTEAFRTLLLNSSNQIFREVLVSQGTLNASMVHPREVFRIAITESAAAVILLHNHPSGNCEPSKDDIAITKNLVQAGGIIDIKVLDHLIIAGDSFTSFAQRGLM